MIPQRYIVEAGAEHPCCHTCQVLDTETRSYVCECWDEETAQQIADALNAAQPKADV